MSDSGDSTADSQPSDRCQAVTEVAMEQAMQKAMEECGSEEAVRRQICRMVGMDDEEEPSRPCDEVLTDGLDSVTLSSMKLTREWVMCRAWQLVRNENKALSSAVSSAWAEARAKGDELGIEV